MAVLSEPMKRLVCEQRLGFVATVCQDGTPNLSPKGTPSVWDDEHLIFADLSSPTTLANLRANPAIEINVVDWLRARAVPECSREARNSSGAWRSMREAGCRMRPGVSRRRCSSGSSRSDRWSRPATEEMRRRWKAYYDRLELA
jgi:hypothetical protein